MILDVLLAREPHTGTAAALTARVERGELDAPLCATTLTTMHDVSTRTLGTAAAREAVADLLRVFGVAPVTRTVLEEAIGLLLNDYEDAVLHEAARHAGAEAIVTRNERNFRGAVLRVYGPVELEAALTAEGWSREPAGAEYATVMALAPAFARKQAPPGFASS